MRATINGVQIGYDDFGQGPTVLFIHDYPLTREMWRPQVDPLVAAGFRVVLIDLRGFGASSLGSGKVDIQAYSADVIGLLNYLGIGRAVVCGLWLVFRWLCPLRFDGKLSAANCRGLSGHQSSRF